MILDGSRHDPPTDAEEGRGHYRYLICIVVFSGFFLSIFHRFAAAAIAVDLQTSFNVSAALHGVLAGLFLSIRPHAVAQRVGVKIGLEI